MKRGRSRQAEKDSLSIDSISWSKSEEKCKVLDYRYSSLDVYAKRLIDRESRCKYSITIGFVDKAILYFFKLEKWFDRQNFVFV